MKKNISVGGGRDISNLPKEGKILNGDIVGLLLSGLVLLLFLFLVWSLLSFLPLWAKIGITVLFLIWALKKIGLLYLWAV